MSFIRPQAERLRERGIEIRREIIGFVSLVTVWAVLLNVTASFVFDWVKGPVLCWAGDNVALAAAGGVVCFLLLLYGGAALLTAGLVGSMEEERKLHIVVPLLKDGGGLRIAHLEGYGISESVDKELSKAPGEELLKALQDRPVRDRPHSGKLQAYLVDSLAAAMLDDVAKSCQYLLSDDALFHGLDYGRLGGHNGKCRRSEVREGGGKKLFLPRGCRAELLRTGPDCYGKRGREIRITGPFGVLAIRVWPQWAMLSADYHSLSQKLVDRLLDAAAKNYGWNRPAARQARWTLEAPVRIHVHFRNWKNPVFFATKKFEVYAEWLCDLVNRLEERWSWEAFVQRHSNATPLGASGEAAEAEARD